MEEILSVNWYAECVPTSETAPARGTSARLRRDASANRDKIVAAAREVYARRGLDVSMEEIAAGAGVGLATLHRRFSREQLVEAVFAERAREYLALALGCRAEPDKWNAFVSYLERLCAMHVADRCASDVLTLRLPHSPLIADLRDQIYYAQLELIRQAQAQGTLRADFVPEDVILILLAVGGVTSATARTAPESWRRVFALIVGNLRAESADELPAPPRAEDLLAALAQPRAGRRPSGLSAP
jgi:AcrR family transcriptional regulator